MYLILLWVLVKLQAPIWLIIVDIICIAIKLIECGTKLGK